MMEPMNEPSYRHTCDRCGATAVSVGMSYVEGWAWPFRIEDVSGPIDFYNRQPYLCPNCMADWENFCSPIKRRWEEAASAAV